MIFFCDAKGILLQPHWQFHKEAAIIASDSMHIQEWIF